MKTSIKDSFEALCENVNLSDSKVGIGDKEMEEFRRMMFYLYKAGMDYGIGHIAFKMQSIQDELGDFKS